MKTGYAVRKDGLGWRAVDEQSWCTKDETFQIDIPPLPSALVLDWQQLGLRGELGGVVG